ncbi:hypothetical protein BCR42DRAFT_430470 [Absidia repens]|uniref:Uncharacterized protein n=1 Tax=Absidia repens TaxID=90262 RepID=A0A1X2HDV9_9FUNG|nr:hypothetical protein BCR42DRAFT_430470 [Absidia repens]
MDRPQLHLVKRIRFLFLMMVMGACLELDFTWKGVYTTSLWIDTSSFVELTDLLVFLLTWFLTTPFASQVPSSVWTRKESIQRKDNITNTI